MKRIHLFFLPLLLACSPASRTIDSQGSVVELEKPPLDSFPPTEAKGFSQWYRMLFIINPDSVEVKNRVMFSRFKYYGDEYNEQDAVKFRLEVTNKSNKPIPTIQTARFSKSQLHIFIDGQNAMQMSLSNGIFGGDQSISKDSTDTWDLDLQITGPNAIDYGDVFTWQWEYMGIKSPIMQVDVKNRIITEVKQHIKTDRVFF